MTTLTTATESEPAAAAGEVVVRPLEERDLPAADRVFRLAFGTMLGLPEPIRFAEGADLRSSASGPASSPPSLPRRPRRRAVGRSSGARTFRRPSEARSSSTAVPSPTRSIPAST
jgi:hypothetical protein